MKRHFSYPEGVRAIRLATWRSRLAGQAVHAFRAGPWVIDAGFGAARRQLLRWHGLDGAQACLLTHHDEDHTGGAAALSSRGIPVLAPAQVIERLKLEERLPFYRLWAWGSAPPAEARVLAEEISAGGWHLVAYHTPGHSADHHVFYEPDRCLLFSGDLYLSRRVPVARPREDLAQLLDSLRRVRDLKPATLFCAHRGRVERAVEVLSAKIDWTEKVIASVTHLHRQGMEVEKIALRVLGRKSFVDWFSGGDYSRRNLVEAALRVGC